jgi:hypothetical protein
VAKLTKEKLTKAKLTKERRNMKKLAWFGLVLALSLALSAPLSAQRGGTRGGGARTRVGGTGIHPVGVRSTASYFPAVYSGANYYAPVYGYGIPQAYTTNPYPDSQNGGPMVIVSPPIAPDAGTNIVYIPSYARPSNGPSLGEIAAQLKAEKQTSKYIWRNVEPLLQPKEDPK